MDRLNPLMQQVEICERYGWTYEQYLEQPSFFLAAIREKMKIDAKRQALEMRKMKHGK